AMMVGLGAVRLVFQPDMAARKWIPIVDPPLRDVRIDGEIGWRDAVCPGSPSINTRIEPVSGRYVVHISGAAVGSCGEFSLYRLVMPQPQYFEDIFRQLWRELGGTLAKGIHEGTVPADATVLA